MYSPRKNYLKSQTGRSYRLPTNKGEPHSICWTSIFPIIRSGPKNTFPSQAVLDCSSSMIVTVRTAYLPNDGFIINILVRTIYETEK